MKKFVQISCLFVLGCLFCFAVSAQTPAQSKVNWDDLASKQTELMTKNLSLNADQTAKIKQINLDYAKKMNTTSKQDLKKWETDKDAEFKKVLTDDQYRKWESNKKTWMDDLNKNANKLKKEAQSAKPVK